MDPTWHPFAAPGAATIASQPPGSCPRHPGAPSCGALASYSQPQATAQHCPPDASVRCENQAGELCDMWRHWRERACGSTGSASTPYQIVYNHKALSWCCTIPCNAEGYMNRAATFSLRLLNLSISPYACSSTKRSLQACMLCRLLTLVGDVPADEGAYGAALRILRGTGEARDEQQRDLDSKVLPGDGCFAQAIGKVLWQSA